MIKICLAVLIGFAGAAFAQGEDSVDASTAETLGQFGGWKLECAHYKMDKTRKICRLSQLFAGSDQTHWATAVVVPNQGAYALLINTFVYRENEKPALIKLDGKEAGQAIFQCSTSVCGYVYRVDGEDLSKYLAAKELELTVPPESSPTSFQLDLRRFKAALDGLKDAQNKP